MIVVVGTLRTPADGLAAALPAMTKMVEATRREAGCIEYGFSIDLLDPTLLHITERWESREALNAHSKAPHIAEWLAISPTLGFGARDLHFYDVVPPAGD